MKSICIAGASQSDLLLVYDILQQAGMKPARPVKRDESIDVAFWHEQVLAIAMEESSENQPIPEPGRLWEQLATDIFVANVKSDVWGWADDRSTWLLDFWLNFDPRLYFILVCEAPQETLAGALSRGTDAAAVETTMTKWQAANQELLRFHLRNPDRSLLVDIHGCADHPRKLIERCTAKWKISLPFSVAAASPHPKADPLSLYLGHQLCKDYADTISLRNELAATIAHLGTVDALSYVVDTDPVQIISAYQTLREQAAKLPQAEASFDNLNAKFNESVGSKAHISAELQHARAAHDVLNSLFEDTVVSHTRVQQGLEDRIIEATKENELLLLQLLQLQEELEVSVHESNARAERLNAAEVGFEEAAQECELLKMQLQQLQDELGTQLQQSQQKAKQLTEAEEMWQRLLQRIPDYRDNDSVEYVPIESIGNSASTNRRSNLNGSGHSSTKLAIKTVAIHRGSGSLIRWPISAASSLLQSFTRMLTSPSEPPTLLTYDRVNLKREQVNPDYEHLWLRFENLALDAELWPEFEFRLSCADVRPGHFGHFPKLEFPEETSQSPFERWFVESYDDFGAKLELRFAIPETSEPESMDLAVWQRVSDNDRAFLASLIASLPKILADLKDTGVYLKRSWEDWGRMAQEIQRVVALRVSQPSARRRLLPAKSTSVSQPDRA